jgi:hypothetical protein
MPYLNTWVAVSMSELTKEYPIMLLLPYVDNFQEYIKISLVKYMR